MGIYLASELIPAANLPDFKATIPGGGDAIELATTAGGTGDASDLTVMLTFVSES